MTTKGKLQSVFSQYVRLSRGEAWQSLLKWPVLPHVQHALRSFFSRRRRCWEGALFAAAGMSVISSSFNCRTTSASSSPTLFRVVTVATAASVTSTVGCRSSWSATAFTEETLALSVRQGEERKREKESDSVRRYLIRIDDDGIATNSNMRDTKAGGIREGRWKTTRFRSGIAAVDLAWSDVVNAGFVLSTATLEMTPSLSMVNTLYDLSSILCGRDVQGRRVRNVSERRAMAPLAANAALLFCVPPRMPSGRCKRRLRRPGRNLRCRRPLDTGAVHMSDQGRLEVAVETFYDAVGLWMWLLGTPKRAIQLVRKARATVVAVMSWMGEASGHMVNLSMAVRRYLKPSDCGSGTTMSRWTCSKQCAGRRNSASGEGMCRCILARWQLVHARVHRTTSPLMPGHTYLAVIRRLVARMPGCDRSWMARNVGLRSGAGSFKDVVCTILCSSGSTLWALAHQLQPGGSVSPEGAR
ncbi:hypothetical protein T08_5017 [Trichinella sp. T8]|nr:hypothetical protein T08_5017 [Trichinella sp. T8]